MNADEARDAAMSGHQDETALLVRLRSGEEAAFAELVRNHHRALLAVAGSLLSGGEAEEVVQEAWINAHRALPAFEGRAALRTWLTRIVINQARMRLRRVGRELSLEDFATEADPFADRFASDGHWQSPPQDWGYHSPEALLEERDLADCLQRQLDNLSANQRLVIELRDLQGQAIEEICNSLALTASNVRVLLHRARATLFRHIEHYRETGEC